MSKQEHILTGREERERKRIVVDMVQTEAERLGAERDKRSNPQRYNAVIELWYKAQPYHLNPKWVQQTIGVAFGLGYEAVWRIITANKVRTGQARRQYRSLGGYDRTFEIIDQKTA